MTSGQKILAHVRTRIEAVRLGIAQKRALVRVLADPDRGNLGRDEITQIQSVTHEIYTLEAVERELENVGRVAVVAVDQEGG